MSREKETADTWGTQRGKFAKKKKAEGVRSSFLGFDAMASSKSIDDLPIAS